MTTVANDARLELHMPLSLKNEIEQAADRQHRSLAEFATTALVEAARKALSDDVQDHRIADLSARDMARFLEMLDAQDSPNPALLKAAEFHRHSVVRRAGD